MAARGTKIKVGFQSTASHSAPVAPASHPSDTPGLGGEGPGGGGLNRAATTLSDLCNSSFGRRRSRRRDGRGKASAVDTAASKAKSKDAAAQKARAAATNEQPNRSGGPQVEIINGKIVVRESSLVVNQGSSAPVDYEEVEEGIHPTATYSSFSKRIYSSPWGVEETRRFYESLRMCGTDFSMLQVFFPGRTRQQLKSKFFREEKEHPELIKCALDSRLPLDLSPFEIHMSGLTEMVSGGVAVAEGGGAVVASTAAGVPIGRGQKRTRASSQDKGSSSRSSNHSSILVGTGAYRNSDDSDGVEQGIEGLVGDSSSDDEDGADLIDV